MELMQSMCSLLLRNRTVVRSGGYLIRSSSYSVVLPRLRCISTAYQAVEMSSSVWASKCPSTLPNQMTRIVYRSYAKGKDKKKPEKGKKSVQINDLQLAEVINVENLKSQMQKSVDKLKEEYVQNLSLRSTTGSIETLQISLDGKDYTLQELAQIVRKNPKTVVINMTTFPQAIPAAIQAIQKSGMNLNPQQDGTTLFIPVPKITKEHRENLSKSAKVLFIKCRDSIKDTQNKYLKSIKSNNAIAKDTSHDVQNQIVSLADQYISSADKIMELKQAELTGGT